MFLALVLLTICTDPASDKADDTRAVASFDIGAPGKDGGSTGSGSTFLLPGGGF